MSSLLLPVLIMITIEHSLDTIAPTTTTTPLINITTTPNNTTYYKHIDWN